MAREVDRGRAQSREHRRRLVASPHAQTAPRRTLVSLLLNDHGLLAAVRELRAAIDAAPLPLDLPGTAADREERGRVIDQLDDYLLPRLQARQAPMVVVVGGPTGAGKSTLVNSLMDRPVSVSGVLRPTTRSPVLVCHPDDLAWFSSSQVLPALHRVDHPTTSHEDLQVVAEPSALPGMAILDAPDFDSIDDDNRELATRLLGAADLWLFVTSAARYADQVPWQFFEQALDRELPVGIVMNRVPPHIRTRVTADLERRLAAHDVGPDRTFYVEVGEVGADGRLARAQVTALRSWLSALAGDQRRRDAVVDQAVAGGLVRACRAALRVADAVGPQVEAVGELLATADRCYGEIGQHLTAVLADGSLLRGDLAEAWRTYAGVDTGALDLAESMALLRERVGNDDAECKAQVDRLALALDTALENVLVEHAERAAEQASGALRATASGDALLRGSEEDLSRPARQLPKQTRRAVRAWRQALVDRVGSDLAGGEGATETGATGLAVALSLRATSPAGASAVPGPGAAGLVAHARDSVRSTLTALLTTERDRYLAPVFGWQLAADAPRRLRDAVRAVDGHRRTTMDQRGDIAPPVRA